MWANVIVFTSVFGVTTMQFLSIADDSDCVGMDG